jgi:hypothetical protein
VPTVGFDDIDAFPAEPCALALLLGLLLESLLAPKAPIPLAVETVPLAVETVPLAVETVGAAKLIGCGANGKCAVVGVLGDGTKD